MKKLRLLSALFALAISLLVVSGPVALTGCNSQVTLEPGGTYTQSDLAIADRSILDASRAMTGFVEWAKANAVYLARRPEVGELASKIAAQKDVWIRDAYIARDIYAEAAKAYRSGPQGPVDAAKIKLDAAISVIENVTRLAIQYRNAH